MDDFDVLYIDKWSIQNVLQHIQVHGAVAEAKLNVSKSTCLGELGDLSALKGFITCKGVMILGMEVNPELTGQRVWEKIEAKVKQKLGLWHMHCLSIGRRMTCMRVVLLPVLLYTALAFPHSEQIVHTIQRATCIFWGSRREKVVRKTLYKQNRQGAEEWQTSYYFFGPNTQARSVNCQSGQGLKQPAS